MIYVSWLLKFISVLIGAACSMQALKFILGSYAIITLLPKINSQEVDPEKLGYAIPDAVLFPLIGTLILFFIARWIWKRGTKMARDYAPVSKLK
jgi:hypothetical protein